MKDKREGIKDTLNELAVSALTQSEEALRGEFEEAGISTEAEISRLRYIVTSKINQFKRSHIDALPNMVPEDRQSMLDLLDQLMTFPGINEGELMNAHRDKTELTDNDRRIITENLLTLIKRRNET